MAYNSILGKAFGRFAGQALGGQGGAEMQGQMMALQQLGMEGQLEAQKSALMDAQAKRDAADQMRALQSPDKTVQRINLSLTGKPMSQPEAMDTARYLGGESVDRFDPNMGPAQSVSSDLAKQFAAISGKRSGDFGSVKDAIGLPSEQAGANYERGVYERGDPVEIASAGSKNPMQVMQSRIFARVQSGELTPAQGAELMAASEGKGRFDISANGVVFDKFGGKVDASNPVATAGVAKTNAEAEKARADAIKAQAGDTTKAPPGYRYLPDGNMEAVPGGPADVKAQIKAEAAAKSAQGASEGLDALEAAATSLMNHKGLAGITGLRGSVPDIPGSDAANARAELETLKAKVAFSTLQAMRDASKTGGALGSTSDKEMKLLENAIAALSTSQSEEQFKASLGKIIDQARQFKSRISGAASGVIPVPGGPVQIKTAADYNALPSGAVYIDPTGKKRTKQ